MRLIILALSFVFLCKNAFALNVPLTVTEEEGIARSGEMVHNGMPIAASENITSTSNLIVTNSLGTQIPATFEVFYE